MQYWYNIDTREVESDDTRGRNDQVMGPYDTREEAARAVQTAREKTERWDEEDRRWEQGED